MFFKHLSRLAPDGVKPPWLQSIYPSRHKRPNWHSGNIRA
jgi:hypothetical protein